MVFYYLNFADTILFKFMIMSVADLVTNILVELSTSSNKAFTNSVNVTCINTKYDILVCSRVGCCHEILKRIFSGDSNVRLDFLLNT